MSEKKKRKPINPRTFNFFIGVMICLFAVILIMNVGYPARAFAFPFFYAFGLISYIVYLIIYGVGLSYLFRGKGLKIRINLRFLGGLLLFVSLVLIATLVQCKGNLPTKDFVSTYNHLVFDKREIPGYANQYEGYWNEFFINMFGISPFGGIFGYMLISLLPTNLQNGLGWAIAVILAVLGLFLFFIKNIVALVKKQKGKEVKKEKVVTEEKPSYVETSIGYQSNEREIIRNATRLDNNTSDDVHSMGVSSVSHEPVNYNQRSANAQVTNVYATSGLYAGDTTFIPARFIRHSAAPIDNSASQNQPVTQPQPQTVTPEQALIEKNQESTKFEQMQLNFEEKPQFNQELLTAKPEFAPVENKPSIAPAQPQIVTQPINPATEQVKKPRVKWVPPSVALLEELQVSEAADKNNAVAEERMNMINSIFSDFHIGASCIGYVVGPSVTNFKISYESNVTVRSVANLIPDISVRLGGVAARFEGVVEGTTYSGIEVSNAVITPVSFKETFEALPDPKKKPLMIAFGKNIEGQIVCRNFADFPHMLVAGTTGSGKSVFIHSVICSLIMRNSPDDLKLVLMDPKQVEMASYKNIPHLLCPIITDVKKAKGTMDKLVEEMNNRYHLFEDNVCRSITEYNDLAEEEGKEKLPYIVVIIDEYADLVQTCKDIATPVVQIAQKARAAGIHMLISTQRPSTDVITGVIKGNLPTRVALLVSQAVDSMTILGEGGAEKLLGKGDMLASSPVISTNGPMRLQGCFIQSKEMRHIIGYLREHYEVNYDPKFLNIEEEGKEAGKEMVEGPAFNYTSEDDEEAKYKSVKEWVMSNKYMSMSRIQRECSVGFNRAGRFFKRLQDEGVVATETEGNKGCPVLTNDDFYENDDDNVVTSSEQSSL